MCRRRYVARLFAFGRGWCRVEVGCVVFCRRHAATRRVRCRVGRCVCTARWWRAPAAPLALLAVPGGEGCAPLPPAPHPRQAELAGFCALSRACCASRRVFLCSRTEPPACVVLAHAATRLCCAGACSHPPSARWWRAPSAPLALLAVPEGKGLRAPTPDPHPRQAELAGFCALRARAALRAGGFVLAHGATRRVCAGACSHHPPVCAQSQLRQSLPPTLSHCSKASLSCSE